MVFAINPPSSPAPQDFNAFINNALSSFSGFDSDLKISIQKMTGLAGVALLVGWLA